MVRNLGTQSGVSVVIQGSTTCASWPKGRLSSRAKGAEVPGVGGSIFLGMLVVMTCLDHLSLAAPGAKFVSDTGRKVFQLMNQIWVSEARYIFHPRQAFPHLLGGQPST